MTPLKAITFDLDDTLWDNSGVMARTETGHYGWLLEALETWLAERRWSPVVLRFEDGLQDYLKRRQQLAVEVPERRGDFTWLRLRALEGQLEAQGLPRSAAQLWAAAAMNEFHRLRVQVTPHPEAAELLAALRQRYQLAAITNGNIHLKRQPLASYFHVAIAAGELLTPKPDPSAFLTALARLNVAPQNAMHVGDSWEEDIVPAQRLGMQAVWVSETRFDALPEGIHQIAHIKELPGVLATLNASY
ncbi:MULTISPECIES: HAD family hydrolase [unclassified Halomonas]|uniref:HAD family hydrolase n=1 Tax=unclassified Halomonas TaxID=2609666 RepID=UPI0006D9AB89|nr:MULTISPECIES: HAD family hydrolase [unclassified Halomonas]KPQ30947.1 MAG: 5-Amino-6-(5'-phosphoribitylamino)uracil phosphatase PyrP [Halomonas sp. HL-93]SBR44984.1 putative hydrolase of the HAD superfamily [Halomonas sp. HL-93]SNY97767.1 putative hydrolase of the HAD superfamily [Halomonas sp. hl-4]